MRGPYHYLGHKLSGENPLQEVLSSGNQRDIKGTRAVAALMVGAFASLSFYSAATSVETAEEAYRAHDQVIAGAEALGSLGEVGASVLSGWVALEMASFVLSSTSRIKELSDG